MLDSFFEQFDMVPSDGKILWMCSQVIPDFANQKKFFLWRESLNGR